MEEDKKKTDGDIIGGDEPSENAPDQQERASEKTKQGFEEEKAKPAEEKDVKLAPEQGAPEKEQLEKEAQAPQIKPSEELEQIMQEALESVERAERKKKEKEEEPRRPSPQEMELRLKIIDLQHKIRELETELDKKAKEIRQNYEQAVRIKEQFDAYKARALKEKADWFNYGYEPLLKELLGVVDNLERAIEHCEVGKDFEGLKKGVELVLRGFMQVLEKFGVTQIEAIGKPFDPVYHEAVQVIETNEYPQGTVIKEHTKGYMLKDRLLRPATVSVSRLPQMTDGEVGVQPTAQGFGSGEEPKKESEELTNQDNEIKGPETKDS